MIYTRSRTPLGKAKRLLEDHAPDLTSVFGCGRDTVAQLLITADNLERLRSEAAFATLAGAPPIPASSGKTNRHRLNRAGDRQANSALYHVVMMRLRDDQEARNYATPRIAEGKTKMEIIRCRKRYLVQQLSHSSSRRYSLDASRPSLDSSQECRR